MSHTRSGSCEGAVWIDTPVLENAGRETAGWAQGRRETRRKPRLHLFSQVSCFKYSYLTSTRDLHKVASASSGGQDSLRCWAGALGGHAPLGYLEP